MWDFRIPPRCISGLRSSGMLGSVDWCQLPAFRDSQWGSSLRVFDCLSLENGTDGLSRNVPTTSLRCITTQKNEWLFQDSYTLWLGLLGSASQYCQQKEGLGKQQVIFVLLTHLPRCKVKISQNISLTGRHIYSSSLVTCIKLYISQCHYKQNRDYLRVKCLLKGALIPVGIPSHLILLWLRFISTELWSCLWFYVGVRLGRLHWGRNVHWGFSRIGCWGGYLGLRGTR